MKILLESVIEVMALTVCLKMTFQFNYHLQMVALSLESNFVQATLCWKKNCGEKT